MFRLTNALNNETVLLNGTNIETIEKHSANKTKIGLVSGHSIFVKEPLDYIMSYFVLRNSLT